MKRIVFLMAALLMISSAALVLPARAAAPLTLTLTPNPPAGTPIAPGQGIATTVAVRRDGAPDGQQVSVDIRFDPDLELFDYGGAEQCWAAQGNVHCSVYVTSDQPALVSFAVRAPDSWRCGGFTIRAEARSFDGQERATAETRHPQAADCAIALPLIRLAREAYPAP